MNENVLPNFFFFLFLVVFITHNFQLGVHAISKLLYPNNELLKQIEIKHIDIMINYLNEQRSSLIVSFTACLTSLIFQQ